MALCRVCRTMRGVCGYMRRGPDPPKFRVESSPGECQGRRWPGKAEEGARTRGAQDTQQRRARSGGATRGGLSLNPRCLPLPSSFKGRRGGRKLSATARPFVLGPARLTPVTDRGGGRGVAHPEALTWASRILLALAPLWTQRRRRVQALRGPGVASPGRDGSREEWGGRWPRARRSLLRPESYERGKGQQHQPKPQPAAPCGLANSPPRTMSTPGRLSPPRSPAFLLTPPTSGTGFWLPG